jgi:hypothetical protein
MERWKISAGIRDGFNGQTANLWCHTTLRWIGEFLRKQRPIPNIALLYWRGLLVGFIFHWKANWEADRACKESGLIWQLWHRVLAVNEWKAKISPQIELDCFTCDFGEPDSIMHRFWSCSLTTSAWDFALTILSGMSSPLQQLAPSPCPTPSLYRGCPADFRLSILSGSTSAVWLFGPSRWPWMTRSSTRSTGLRWELKERSGH